MPDIQKSPLEECDEDIALLYLKTASNQLKRMNEAAHSKSMPKLQRLAHKLCGASGYLGLTGMAKISKDLEQAASRNEWDEALQFLGLAKAEYGQVQQTYNRHKK